MKKLALFALALLVGLPGCRREAKQERTQTVETEQRVDMFSSDNMNDYDVEEEYEEEDLRTLFDFDDEAKEFVSQDDYYVDQDDYYNDSQDIAWIDVQMDDELKPLYFEFNKYELNTTQKQAFEHDIEQVRQLLSEAGKGTSVTVVAEGYTDKEGTPEYNLVLSENRAKNVADLLVAAGIDRSNIKVVGRGQENQVVEGTTRAERAPNRRVELRVIYT